MTKARQRMGWMLAIACLTVLVIVTTLMFSSELVTQADRSVTNNQVNLLPLADQSPVLLSNRAFLEEMRQQYANLETVVLEANVDIRLKGDRQPVSGQATIKYSASGSRYRYEVVLSEDLVKAGLMRNVTVAWNGQQYFFYDPAINVLSIQKEEEKRYIAAVPNPFFLPLDFLGSNDDSCPGCMLRLQDIGNEEKWDQRQQTLRVLTSEQGSELIHDVLATKGGISQGEQFDYVLRIVGQKKRVRQLNSISRTALDGRRLAEIVFTRFENVDGFNLKIPFETSIVARDPSGMPALFATFKFSKLVLNAPIDESTFRLLPEKGTRVVDAESSRIGKE